MQRHCRSDPYKPAVTSYGASDDKKKHLKETEPPESVLCYVVAGHAAQLMLRTVQKKFTLVDNVFGNTWIMLNFDGGGQVTLKSNEVTLYFR